MANLLRRLACVAALALTAAEGGKSLDVREFGAACDGILDDAVALQWALEALGAGETLQVPAGCTMGMGAGVRLTGKRGVTVRGEDGSGLRALGKITRNGIASGLGPYMLVVENCVACVVEGLVFDSAGQDVAGVGFHANQYTVFRNNTVQNVGLVSGGAVAAVVNLDNRYIGNRIRKTVLEHTNGTRGMWIGNYLFEDVNPVIAHNTLTEIGGTGIAAHTVGGIIAANRVDGASGACIKRVPKAGSRAPALIEQNVVRGCGFHGIQLDNDTWNLTVRNNVIETNRLAGIYALKGFSGSRIEWNVIRDNDQNVAAGWHSGVWISHAKDSVIEHNVIVDTREGSARTQDNAINLFPGEIRNLTIRNNECSNSTQNGIVTGAVRGPIVDVQITGNRCTANRRFGIQLVREKAEVNVCEYGNELANNGLGEIEANFPIERCRPPVPGPSIQSDENLPKGEVGEPFLAMLEVAEGREPYRWEAGYDAMPPGLYLEPSGALMGMPELEGTFEIPIFVYDDSTPAQSGFKVFRLRVEAPQAGAKTVEEIRQ